MVASLLALAIVSSAASSASASAPAKDPAAISSLLVKPVPSDPKATAATSALLLRLGLLSSSPSLKFLFGQQDTNIKGDGWTDPNGEQNRSDVKTTVGDFPAVFGFNLASLTGLASEDEDLGLEGPELIAATFEASKHAAALGAVITGHFPVGSPFGGGQKDGKGNPMANLVPGKAANKKWTEWLDLVANYALSLSPYPILFRPFHEMYGKNWWGKVFCSVDEFVAGWRYTISYLRDKGVHNLLLVFAPNHLEKFNYQYGERYPGDEFVDVVAFDAYDGPTSPHACEKYGGTIVKYSSTVSKFAKAHNKVAAIAEFGVKKGLGNTLDANWWTDCFLAPLSKNPSTFGIAYAMTWTNSQHDFTPLPGDATSTDFKSLYASGATKFLKDWHNMTYQ